MSDNPPQNMVIAIMAKAKQKIVLIEKKYLETQYVRFATQEKNTNGVAVKFPINLLRILFQ